MSSGISCVGTRPQHELYNPWGAHLHERRRTAGKLSGCRVSHRGDAYPAAPSHEACVWWGCPFSLWLSRQLADPGIGKGHDMGNTQAYASVSIHAGSAHRIDFPSSGSTDGRRRLKLHRDDFEGLSSAEVVIYGTPEEIRGFLLAALDAVPAVEKVPA